MKKLFFVIALLLLAGCSTAQTAVLQEAPKTVGIKTANIKPDEEPRQQPVKMLFFGDMMMGRFVRTLMQKNGLDYSFQKINHAENPDLVIANLEGPIVSNPIYSQTGMTFGFAADTAQILKRNGIDIVGIANNHSLDRGQKGFEETKKYLSEAGIEYFGNPILPNESEVLVKTINKQKFAFIGLHDATRRLDEKAAAELTRKFDSRADKVIVFIHWGPEYKTFASKRQQDIAHILVDAGADLIIGHHPHVAQNREDYKNVAIYYSLGNYIFDQYWSDRTQHGLAVEVEWPAEGTMTPPIFTEKKFSLYKSVPEYDP